MLNEEPETFLTLAQGLFGLPQIGNIPHCHRASNYVALSIAYRGSTVEHKGTGPIESFNLE